MYKYKTFLNRLLLNSRRNFSDTRSILDIIKTGQVGETISVQGWIKSLRKQKKVTFIDINDGSTPVNLQIVLTQETDRKISVGSSISTSGILKQSPRGQNEVSAANMELIGECDLDKGYPFAPRKEYEPEYVREHLHFRPRTRKFASLLRLRHAANFSIHNYLHDKGYFNIHTPILTSNDCEGAGEIFKVLPDNEKLLKSMEKENQTADTVYFDTKAYLTVSGQLHLEAAAQALNKVYCFGPTFRAENSRSRFHLSEFYMLELEQAFLSSLDELLIIVEDLIKNVTSNLLQKYSDDVEVCTQNKVNHKWIDKAFIKITYEEALDILRNKLNKTVKEDIVKEHELALTEYFDQVPVFVINWPKNQKPFYMKEIANGNVAAFDLLAPQIGEIAGGSLREDNYEKLKIKLANNSQLDWYLDLRKFGCVPTGGFGLGFERYLQFVLGIDTVRDSIPFPRWPHNCRL